MLELNKFDRMMINMLVDGYHVSASNKMIMREFWNRDIFRSYPKITRKAVYQYAIERHRQNKDLYYFVMR